MRANRLLIGAVALVVMLAAAAWAGRGLYRTAGISVAYVAKQTCSCLHVAVRPMASCRTDFDADAIERIRFETTPNSVTVAALGGLVSAKAEFAAGFGCHPVD